MWHSLPAINDTLFNGTLPSLLFELCIPLPLCQIECSSNGHTQLGFRHGNLVSRNRSRSCNWTGCYRLVLTICLERLMGIRYPLSVRKDRVFQTPVIILGIVTMTGLLSFYKHVVRIKTFLFGYKVNSRHSIVWPGSFAMENNRMHGKIKDRGNKWDENFLYFRCIHINADEI